MITKNQARQIASEFQSPGTHGKRFAEFASTGDITDINGLFADITREMGLAIATGDYETQSILNQLKEYLEEL